MTSGTIVCELLANVLFSNDDSLLLTNFDGPGRLPRDEEFRAICPQFAE